jgi:CBS domain-containing protein
MDDWVEDDLSLWKEGDETGERRVLDERMIREPIRTLTPRPPLSVPRGASIASAVALMRDHRLGCVLVVENDRLVGIVTERDLLLKVIGTGADLEALTVEDVMTPDPEVLHPDDAIVFALNKMSVGGFRHVPLVDEAGRPVGIVSVKLIVEYIVDFFPREVLNLPPEPGKNLTRAREGA